MSFRIETERLILRDIRYTDIPVLSEFYAESAARKRILSHQHDPAVNLKELKHAIIRAKQPERIYYNLAVLRKSDKTLIGSCSITNTFSESVESFLGWHFSSRFWGRGFATEAARELLRIGFEMHQVTCIFADCFGDNFASIRVMEKIGMKPHMNNGPMNFLRGMFYGELRPTVRYVIYREDLPPKSP